MPIPISLRSFSHLIFFFLCPGLLFLSTASYEQYITSILGVGHVSDNLTHIPAYQPTYFFFFMYIMKIKPNCTQLREFGIPVLSAFDTPYTLYPP
ncbi:uncharacterized protein F4822DRAFT_117571 [Hypoxylon trugodes]|uniref:uncharacterized protein n=1 Tax=Hypoxylon trugodes TaxID=326681 RepID=UPI0021948739|nr:uncharacterized protein F4822DRAFT_117571 [Hypoxylon trugodes]KAI1392171.1 hypothetical protein F4822DRAFT_117571 [Hypoxylon trugodes]